MESTALLNDLVARYSLSEYLPYLAYKKESDCYAMETGIGVVFECNPLQFPTLDNREMLRSLFESAFMAGTSIQFLLYGSKHIEPYLDSYVLSRKSSTGETIYSSMAQNRSDFYKKGATENIIRNSKVKVRNFRLFVSMTIPCAKTPEGYNACIADNIDKYRQNLKQVLTVMGMNPVSMAPEKLISLLSDLLNPGHPGGNTSYDPTVHIRNQVVHADAELDLGAQHLIIDKKYCQSLTVKQYPEEWDMSKSMNFVGSMTENAKQIGVPFLLVMNCEYPDPVKDNASVQKRALTAKYQSFGDFAKWFPQLVTRRMNYDVLLEALENESLFFGYFNIFFFADSEREMYDVNQSFKSLYRSMGIILQDDPFISLPLFLQMLPMGYNKDIQKGVKRRSTRTTGLIAELVPIYADWSGCGRPIIQLVSRRGQVQYFDMFSNTRGGYSAVVVASTGSGKSFFVNEMTVGYLGHGAKIWQIDIGRSYEKLCAAVGGQFIEFSADSDLCLNPFTKINDLDEEMPMLKSIVAQMASREPLDDLNMAFIEEGIREVYDEMGKEMSVDNIITYFQGESDTRQKELAKRLYPYSRRGAYSRLYNGPNNLIEDGNYIVYELEELKSKKDLQEVVLLSLIYQIQQDMLKKDKQKLILIDEAWDLLTGVNTANFIETAYRRFRKYQGACVTITQSVNDFYGIPAGVAALENSDYFFLLRQRPESIEALKKSQRLSLSEGAYELLRSVHTDQGNYSEIFMYTPDGTTISRLVVERYTQLLYTTKAEEFQMIKELVSTGLTQDQAINKIIYNETIQEANRHAA